MAKKGGELITFVRLTPTCRNELFGTDNSFLSAYKRGQIWAIDPVINFSYSPSNIGARKPESNVDHSDNNARTDPVSSDDEGPLFLPKKRRLPLKLSLKSVFSMGEETGSDDSGDGPLSSSSTETIKRKASPSIPSAHLATPPNSEYPSKRHISEDTSINDKGNSVKNVTNPDENGAPNKLQSLYPTVVVEDNRQSIQTEQPKRPTTLLRRKSLSTTNTEIPSQKETKAAASARSSNLATNITPIPSSNVVDEESPRRRHASTAIKEVRTNANALVRT